MDSLKGHLLLASPALFDPNFRRTVVLVTEHGRVIAALGPPVITELPRELAGLQALVARGIAVPGRRKQPGSYPRTGLQSPAGTGQRLIDELRDDR